MNKQTLVADLTASVELINKATTEIGDSYDYEKLTSFTGTPEEKAKAFTAEIEKRNSLQTQLDTMLAMEKELKRNDDIRTSLNSNKSAGFSAPKDVDGEREIKNIKIPARARTSRAKFAKSDQEAYAMGMWFISQIADQTLDGTKRAKVWVGENLNMKALGETNDSTGGALVPVEFLPTLIDIKDTYGVYGRNMQKIPMKSDTLKIPRINSHNSAYWDTESGSVTESAPTFNNIQLVAKKLTSWLALPVELLEDSAIDIGDWVIQDMAWKFAHEEDKAAFIGDGTGTYGNITGFTNALLSLDSTIANIAGLQVATGNLWSEITLTDMLGMIGKLHTQAVPRGVIYCSNTFYWNVLMSRAMNAGGVTANEVVNGVVKYRFQGIPVEMTQALPLVEGNSQVACLYGDVNLASKMGDKRSFSIKTSDQVRFLNDQVVIKAHERLDINVHDVGNASATAASRVPGPMVGLITAAS